MDDADHTVTMAQPGRADAQLRRWADNRLADSDGEFGPAADAAAGLASLSFITTAIRRRRRFWCVVALLGLVVGLGIYRHSPPPHQATTEVLLTFGPDEDPQGAIDTDAALAQSLAVATPASKALGGQQSPGSLLGSYTATPVTPRLFVITTSAATSAEAVHDATVLAAEFLKFRQGQLLQYEKQQLNLLAGQVAQAKANVTSLAAEIRSTSAQPPSPAKQAKLGVLRADQTTASNTVSSLEQDQQGSQESLAVATSAAVNGSLIVNSAQPLDHSRLKTAVQYAGGGLIVGMILGLGFVTVQALVSDRLRRRDDVAYALGAPVRLSVRRLAGARLLPGRRGVAVTRRQRQDLQRVVAHLRRSVPRGQRGAASLAVVPVGRADAAGAAIAALGTWYAQQGKRVIVADLSAGARAARLLGSKAPGVRSVRIEGTRLIVAIPERGDGAQAGPVRGAAASRSEPASEELREAYASADVLLALVPLDPAMGGEYLATWAPDAVVIVSAGESTSTRIHAVGEMIRLAGTSLRSAVLLGADKTDESLGMPEEPEPVPENGLRTDTLLHFGPR